MLKDIVTIVGKPSLYKILSSTGNLLIVEGIENKKRFPVFTSSQVNSLKDIVIYTDTDEVKLSSVFANMSKELDNKECIITKNTTPQDFKDYMEKFLPNYDKERVYPSNMKKIFDWYNILIKNNLIDDIENQ